MAKQQLTQEQKQVQRIALEQQRLLGLMLEKNDAEINEYIDNNIDENQALEKKTDESDNSEPDDREIILDDEQKGDIDSDGSSSEDLHEKEEARREEEAARRDAEEERRDLVEFVVNEIDDSESEGWSRYNASNRSRDDEYLEPVVVAEKTLQEFLNDQLGELELDEAQLLIAKAIVGNLEDDGYLRRSVGEIADDVTFNDQYMVEAPQVEEVLTIVQKLDPPGIAARDLQECMLLQLRRKPESDDVKIAIRIVDECFDQLSNQKYNSISNKLGITLEKTKQVIDQQIRHGINPRPGNAFGTRSSIGVQLTPDFQVEYDEDNDILTVTLLNNIPELQISESYVMMNDLYKRKKQLSQKEQKEKKTIVDAYQRASTFIEVLKQRQETLFNTMTAIVDCQKEYFKSGDERDLHPLGQQQIANMIGKDVSVVSRAINNKYVQLPWGKVKSLKSFFSEDINGASRHKVYDDLKKLVDAEDKSHPLSDDALCARLKELGYQLERRTVAKYRDTLGIPSSPERRKRVH